MTRRGTIPILASLAVAVVVALASPGTTNATSCAPFAVDDMGPVAIVSGEEVMWDGGTFFETFDFAITGTVTSITTDDRRGSPRYGATNTAFEVINGYGVESIGPTLVVSSPDPGWMSGYFFEVGTTYFVPLQAVGQDGRPNASFLCDPITPMTESDARALAALASPDMLVAAPSPAEQSAVTSSTSRTSPKPVSDAGDVQRGDRNARSVAAVVGLVTLAVLGLVGWRFVSARRRRRPSV